MSTYRGRDRRSELAREVPTFGATYLAVAVTLAALMALALAGIGLADGGRDLRAADMLAIATTSLALVAACLQLERWRMAGPTSALWAGAGGFLAAAMVAGRRLLPAARVEIDAGTLGAFSLAFTIVLVLVAAWVALAPDVDPRTRPRTVALVVLAILVVLVPMLDSLDLAVRAGPDPAPGPAGRFVLAGAWALAGVLLVARSRRFATTTAAWLGLFAFAIAGADLAVALQLDPEVLVNPARAAMVTLGALGFVHASERDLRAALTAQAAELDDTRARVDAADDRERHATAASVERAHEARNALAAIDGAIRTLERYKEHLPEDTKAQLSAGVATELHRLQHLVDVEDRAETPTVFRLSEVLIPVVMLARTQGLDLETDMRPDVDVFAARDATIEVVQNLLLNAQRHAGGEGVVLQVGTDGDRAIVRVLDRGPGIPEDQRDVVFGRGNPGDDARGRGFGLYVSRRLVDAQGGTLAAHDRRGGGARFEFDLPLAPSCRRMWAPTVDQRQEVREAHGSRHR